MLHTARRGHLERGGHVDLDLADRDRPPGADRVPSQPPWGDVGQRVQDPVAVPAADRAVRVADPDLGLGSLGPGGVLGRGGARGDRDRRVHRQPWDVPEDAVPVMHPVVPVDQLGDPRAAVGRDLGADPHRADPLLAAQRGADQDSDADQQHRHGEQDQIQPAPPPDPHAGAAGTPIHRRRPVWPRRNGRRRGHRGPPERTAARQGRAARWQDRFGEAASTPPTGNGAADAATSLCDAFLRDRVPTPASPVAVGSPAGTLHR